MNFCQVNSDKYVINGAVSVQFLDQGQMPWRIPWQDRWLFPMLAQDEKSVAAQCAGVRIAFNTDATLVRLDFAPVQAPRQFDLVINESEPITFVIDPGGTQALFDLPQGQHSIEIWLDQRLPFMLSGVYVNEGSSIGPPKGRRKKWLHYGSSISHSIEARSPARTWTAITAAEVDCDLTCLGFGGNCMLEPMVAKVIAAQKANLITLKIGVNTFSGHYSARTFLPAVLGMLYTIREKQTNTPIIVISPFYCPGRETERYTKTSLILPEIRNVLKNTVDLFQSRGDRFIYYLDGLSIFNADKMQYLPDGVHPNAEGQFVIAHAMVPHIQRILCEH